MNGTDQPLEELYREVILDHFRHPHHRGRVPDATADVEMYNPTCGDEVRVTLAIRDGRIVDVGFEGRGCSISMASASMMTDAVLGKTIDEARAVIADFKAMMQGREPAADLGELRALQGVAKFPVRIKCATLAWNTLEKGLGGDGSAAAAGSGTL
jgi:nitrogen fixation NifU-like protein